MREWADTGSAPTGGAQAESGRGAAFPSATWELRISRGPKQELGNEERGKAVFLPHFYIMTRGAKAARLA